MRWFWTLSLRLAGWKTNIVFPYHNIPRYIVIVAPHTSNWDFVVGLAYRSVLRMQHVRFLGKKELFRAPFGFVFRMLGGYPVDRHNQQHYVEQVAALFRNHAHFCLALSPEGTRARVERLRTGFYHIARAAQIPIVMAGLDYAKKEVRFAPLLWPSTDQTADFKIILEYFSEVKGRHPDEGLSHLA